MVLDDAEMEEEPENLNVTHERQDSSPPAEIQDEDPAPLPEYSNVSPEDIGDADKDTGGLDGDLGEAVAAIIAAEEQTILLQEAEEPMG